MSALDLILIAFAFLLVGGWRRTGEELRDFLNFLRPERESAIPRMVNRTLHEPLARGEKEREIAGEATMPPPPPPWALREEPEPNPDHEVKDTDHDLGGVESHIPDSFDPEKVN